MSNDNKTLADVQPGGKVRLGDRLPEAVAQALAVVNEVANDARHAGDYKVANALVTARVTLSKQLLALSAQPAPGGQEDALSELVAMIDSGTSPDYRALQEHRVLRNARASLAARQPVGEPVGYFDPDVLAHLTEGLIDPVGVLRRKPNGKSNVPVWLAPPAQAVDLGAVRALLRRRIAQWRSHLPADPVAPGTREIETKGEHDYNNDVRIYREGIAVMNEVLALIDSQAVGK
ncbi:TPA: hypothetical protein UOJ25_000101 [Stenotrophomonas maltophilia]|nr:hypothetical protein [Stenotrophomonas maltophilia]